MTKIITLQKLVSASSELSKKQGRNSADSSAKKTPVTIELQTLDNKQVSIIDGYHRVRAMLELGYPVQGRCQQNGKRYAITAEDGSGKLIYTEIK